jgi:uncharacterized protein YfiM (DUF2279 family)
MKKLILFFLLLSSSLFSETIGQRKGDNLHFLGSAGIATIGTGIARHYGSDKISAGAIGFSTSIFFGILKEFLDGKSSNHVEDPKDIYIDGIGAFTGAVISAQFEWKF